MVCSFELWLSTSYGPDYPSPDYLTGAVILQFCFRITLIFNGVLVFLEVYLKPCIHLATKTMGRIGDICFWPLNRWYLKLCIKFVYTRVAKWYFFKNIPIANPCQVFLANGSKTSIACDPWYTGDCYLGFHLSNWSSHSKDLKGNKLFLFPC